MIWEMCELKELLNKYVDEYVELIKKLFDEKVDALDFMLVTALPTMLYINDVDKASYINKVSEGLIHYSVKDGKLVITALPRIIMLCIATMRDN